MYWKLNVTTNKMWKKFDWNALFIFSGIDSIARPKCSHYTSLQIPRINVFGIRKIRRFS